MISVIIPVYNVEPYVETCINSIKAQTYKHWECIVVDDCSTDGSLEKVLAMTEGDERFVVVHKDTNEGLPAARNTGIAMACGDALTFIDSDDWVDAGLLDHLAATAQVHSDVGRIATPKYMNWPQYGWFLPWSITPSGLHTSDSPHLFSSVECDVGYCTGNLYVLDNIPCELEFPKVKIYEDMLFNMGLLFAGVDTFVSREYFYHYERRDGSLLSCNYTQEDAEVARKVLKGYADRYNPPKELYERCLAFLIQAQNGKLGTNK